MNLWRLLSNYSGKPPGVWRCQGIVSHLTDVLLWEHLIAA